MFPHIQATARPRLLALLLWSCVAAALLGGCTLLPSGRPSPSNRRLPTPTPLATRPVVTKATYQVERGDVTRLLQLSGRISPVLQKDLFFRAAGRVRSVLVKRQDAVKQGQLLADLDVAAQERDLASARLDLERAQALLAAAERTRAQETRRAEANLRTAQENLAIARLQDPAPKRAEAEARLKKVKLAVAQAQTAYDAIAWRNDRGATPESAALESATLDLQEAQAAYDMAVQAIAVHGHEVTVAEQQVAIAQVAVDALAGPTDPLLQNDVKQAELAVQKLEAGIADAQIVAPFNGIISGISLTEGRPVEAYALIATVADPSSLEIRIDAAGVPLAELQEGMQATITMSGRPGQEIPAHITRIPEATWQSKEDEAEKTVHLAFDGPTTGYQLGDLARTTLVLERKAGVLWLGPAALRTFEGRRFVVVQDGAAQRRVDVKLGIESDERVEIVEGLTEGQTVVGQ
jgi:multidrug efflux pump subunit AcrA (membrane-fusion protein)